MDEFIKALENLKMKIDECQVYAEQARETIKGMREVVEKMEVEYLIEKYKINEKN
jgi:hypothetical protein